MPVTTIRILREADLEAIRRQALDQLVERARGNGIDTRPRGARAPAARGARRLENAGPNESFDRAFEIARGRSIAPTG